MRMSSSVAGLFLLGASLANPIFADGKKLHSVSDQYLIHFDAGYHGTSLVEVGSDGSLTRMSLGFGHTQQVSSTASGWVAACFSSGNRLALFHVEHPERVYYAPLEVTKIAQSLAELDALLEQGTMSEEELSAQFTMERMTTQYETEVNECDGLYLEEDDEGNLFLYVANLIDSRLQEASLTPQEDGTLEIRVERLFDHQYSGVKNLHKVGNKLVGVSSDTNSDAWVWIVDSQSEQVLGGNTADLNSEIWQGKAWRKGLATSLAADGANIYVAAKRAAQILTIATDHSIDDTKADMTKVGPDQYVVAIAANAGKVVTLAETADQKRVVTEFRATAEGLVKVGSQTISADLYDVTVTPDGTVYAATQSDVVVVK